MLMRPMMWPNCALSTAVSVRLKYCRSNVGASMPRSSKILGRNAEFIFPTALSGEQSTSDALAHYHATLVGEGKRVVDLTAGLGIDAMALARKVRHSGHVVAVERDEAVADDLRHNAAKYENIEVINSDCRTLIDIWAREGMRFDVVFIDPARRAADGGRVYALDQCEPDVVEMLPLLRKIADRLIIKASPMLDISHTLSLLPDAGQMIVLGTPWSARSLMRYATLTVNLQPTLKSRQ